MSFRDTLDMARDQCTVKQLPNLTIVQFVLEFKAWSADSRIVFSDDASCITHDGSTIAASIAGHCIRIGFVDVAFIATYNSKPIDVSETMVHWCITGPQTEMLYAFRVEFSREHIVVMVNRSDGRWIELVDSRKAEQDLRRSS
jgi:hypothetical protein